MADDKINDSELYMWDSDYIDGRVPPWFKLWGQKYGDILDLDNIDEEYQGIDKELLFKDMGKAFINALLYFHDFARGQVNEDGFSYRSYKMDTRDGRHIYNALKRDIEASYKDYQDSIKNGHKGGRPRKRGK